MLQDNTLSTKSQALTFQKSEMVQFLKLIIEPGQVTEVRALEALTQLYGRPATLSGYFDDPEKLADTVIGQIKYAKGIYIIPNKVSSALLSRAANRIRPIHRESTTSDADVTARKWLMIDVDPVRPSEISSTDDEHENALLKAREISKLLTSESWPQPILGDSGNGAHLLYRIDLPANDNGLIQKCLEVLAFLYDDSEVTIDRKVFNPARIWKLYGTMACKGDHRPERPHRMSRLLDVPQELVPVPKDFLEKLAARLPVTKKNHEFSEKRNGKLFDVGQWVVAHNLKATGPRPWNDGEKWVLDTCPWNEAHTNRSAFIVQFGNGTIGAGCHHNGCAGKDWHALRDLVEPGWREDHEKQKAEKADSRKPSIADRLCEYALEKNPLLFLDQFGQPHILWEGKPLPLTSRCYGMLRRLMWEKEKRSANGEALSQATGSLAAMAEASPETRELYVRSAYQENAFYVELSPNRVVRINADGWESTANPSVWFRQFPNSKPLPNPENGIDLESLIAMLPLRTDRDQRLFTAYTVLGLHPNISRPILQITGPQGAGKTTSHLAVKRLLDPSVPERIRLDPRDFLQKASHTAVVFIDNATYFSDWAVDGICRLVTGEGDSKRKLYSDDDDVIYELRRLVLINGINLPTNRPDFLDRCLCIELGRIPDNNRATEKEFWHKFELEHPRWLGAIFSLLSSAAKCRDQIKLTSLPRLADWGEWAAAVYEARGWGVQVFVEDWQGNVIRQNNSVIDASYLVQMLLVLLRDREMWEGTPTELLNALNTQAEELKIETKYDKTFPKTADWVWRRIREVIPTLLANGINPTRDEQNDRKITIRKVHKNG